MPLKIKRENAACVAYLLTRTICSAACNHYTHLEAPVKETAQQFKNLKFWSSLGKWGNFCKTKWRKRNESWILFFASSDKKKKKKKAAKQARHRLQFSLKSLQWKQGRIVTLYWKWLIVEVKITLPAAEFLRSVYWKLFEIQSLHVAWTASFLQLMALESACKITPQIFLTE